MAQMYLEIRDPLKEFIRQQKIFFVGTAAPDGRVNVSPKGMDTLRILGSNRIAWLNLTGSGNETAAHLMEQNRITLMFCGFEESAMILRLYGSAKVVHQRDSEWDELFALFPPIPGARQIFAMDVDLVQTSCGGAVPFFDFKGQRDQLKQWAERKGEEGLREYWGTKNQKSIDGRPTGITVEEPVAT